MNMNINEIAKKIITEYNNSLSIYQSSGKKDFNMNHIRVSEEWVCSLLAFLQQTSSEVYNDISDFIIGSKNVLDRNTIEYLSNIALNEYKHNAYALVLILSFIALCRQIVLKEDL